MQGTTSYSDSIQTASIGRSPYAHTSLNPESANMCSHEHAVDTPLDPKVCFTRRRSRLKSNGYEADVDDDSETDKPLSPLSTHLSKSQTKATLARDLRPRE